MSDDDPVNPYAPPEVEEVERKRDHKLAKAERIRREHIKHEASVKSLGCLHILGGALISSRSTAAWAPPTSPLG